MNMYGGSSYSVTALPCYLRCIPPLCQHKQQTKNADRDGESARINVTFSGTGGRHTGGRKLVGREVTWVFIIFLTRIKNNNL